MINSSVIIALSSLGYLDKLPLVIDEIFVAKAVYEEICLAGQGLVGEQELAGTIENHQFAVKEAKSRLLVLALLDSLGAGEAETIVLAIDEHADVIVLDDKAARRKAKALKLSVVGTLRVLRMMYDHQLITKADFCEALEKLREVGFRISDYVVDRVKADL